MVCETIIPWEFLLPKYDVWMCPKCKRLYVFEKGNDTAIMSYVLENTKHNLFKSVFNEFKRKV